MAGVAPQRGGSNASTIGMVVSIVVSVLLLGVLIWLITMQERLRNDASSAISAKERLVRGNEQSTAQAMFPDARGSRNTLVGEMLKGIKLASGRLSGNQEDSPMDAAAKLDATLQELLDEKVVTDADQLSAAHGASGIIRNLHQLYASEKELRLKSQEERDKAELDLEKALATTKQLNADFDKKYEALVAQVDELAKAKTAFEETKSGDIVALQRKAEDIRDQMSSLRREHNQTMKVVRDRFNEQNEILEAQRVTLAELKEPAIPTEVEPLARARKPVGKVLDSLPANALVYIDLGRRDNVALGMTFSVYSADERISESGRGKASIEVVNVDERTSECRVVAPPSPDDPILRGDGVGNIILSKIRARKQRFAIVGEFDIDGDGQVDLRGREKVKALVERWGGVLVDEVDPMTDYVVIGMKPPSEDFEALDASVDALGDIAEDEAPLDEEEWEDEEEGEWEEEDEEASDDEEADAEEDDDAEEEDEDAEDDDAEEDDDADEDEDEDDDADEEEDYSFDPGDGGPADSAAPASPLIERKPEVDPTAGTQTRRARTEMEKYNDALRRAHMFSIPILTQEQFFNFIGIEGTESDARRLRG